MEWLTNHLLMAILLHGGDVGGTLFGGWVGTDPYSAFLGSNGLVSMWLLLKPSIRRLAIALVVMAAITAALLPSLIQFLAAPWNYYS